MKDRRGFTLIELLGTIAILGIIMVIAIPNVSKLIDKAKTNKIESNVRILLMAGKSYTQANKSSLPKSIGAIKRIYAYELKNAGFLKDDLKDSKNQSCMERSYVKVYMKKRAKYIYSAKLCCGVDSCTEDERDNPSIAITFMNANGESLNGKIYNPTDPEIVNDKSNYLVRNIIINYQGNAEDKNIKLSDYGYDVLVSYIERNGTEYVGASPFTQATSFSSPSIDAGGASSKTIELDLADYIDVTKEYYIRIIAKAHNEIGGYRELIKTTLYSDPDGPQCEDSSTVKIYESSGEEVAASNLEWTDKSRKVVMKCNSPVGCKKEEYTQVFTGTGYTDELGMVGENGVGYIFLEDTKGRISACPVNLKIDTAPPTVPTVGMYNWKNNTTRPTNSSGLNEYRSGEWSTLNVFTVPDSTDAGSKGIYYQYTTTGATSNSTDMTAPYRNIEANGKSYIKWRACDKLDNCSKYSDLKSVFIAKNTTLSDPTIKVYKWFYGGNPLSAIKNGTLESFKSGDFTRGSVVVYFTHKDQDKYGVTYHYKQVGDDTVYDVDENYLVLSEEMNRKYKFFATDALGHKSKELEYHIIIDRTPPKFTLQFKKDSNVLKTCTSTNNDGVVDNNYILCNLDTPVDNNLTLVLTADDNGGAGVRSSYTFAWNPVYLNPEFSSGMSSYNSISSSEQRTFDANNSNVREVTYYGGRIAWISFYDRASNEEELKVVMNIISNKSIPEKDDLRFNCNDNNKLTVYYIKECFNNGTCSVGVNNINYKNMSMTLLQNPYVDTRCIKTKYVTSVKGANCRDGANVSVNEAIKKIPKGVELQVSDVANSDWSYVLNKNCFVKNSLLGNSLSDPDMSEPNDDFPTSFACRRYERCAAAGCNKYTQSVRQINGYIYSGNYDSKGICEPAYNPSRCDEGTTCTECQYTEYVYACEKYARGVACACELLK